MKVRREYPPDKASGDRSPPPPGNGQLVPGGERRRRKRTDFANSSIPQHRMFLNKHRDPPLSDKERRITSKKDEGENRFLGAQRELIKMAGFKFSRGEDGEWGPHL
jgi:hypothetical protein